LEASGERKKLSGWKVPLCRSMWMGVKVVGETIVARAICCSGQRLVVGVTVRGVVDEVAITSMPVLSTPRRISRPSDCRGVGKIALPIGTLPGGTIFKKMGVAGSPVIEKVPVAGAGDVAG